MASRKIPRAPSVETWVRRVLRRAAQQRHAGLRALRRRSDDRAAGRPVDTDKALWRRGGEIHRTQRPKAFLPLRRPYDAAHTAPRIKSLQRSEERRVGKEC